MIFGRESSGQGEELVQGSVTVASDKPLSGVVLFGGSVGLAGVGISQPLENGFTAPIETVLGDEGQVNTGVAVMNLTHMEVTLMLKLLDPEGQEIATAELTLASMGHFARFVNSQQSVWTPEVDFTDFKGTIQVMSTGTIAATVIQSRILPDGTNQFATMPVEPK